MEAPSSWDATSDDAGLELRIRIFAVPVALAISWLVVNAGFLRMLVRTFLSMWIHELGHAVTGWFCGFAAIPGPWRTSIPDERSFLCGLLWFAVLATWIGRSWQRRNVFGIGAGVAMVVLQGVCTLVLPVMKARALVTFGGDGGLFVLGTLLMATLFVPPGHHFQRSWLRWGFLVIGAISCADGLKVWWDAHRDFAAIPFGENEGVGLSDASKLVDVYGWDVRTLIGRYLGLAAVCGVALAITWMRGVLQARRS